jgi:carboxypeptidase Taq
MNPQQQQAQLNEFKQYVRKMKQYEEAVSLMHWDMRTGAPKKGIETRSEVVGELSAEIFRMATSSEMGKFLDPYRDLAAYHQLDEMSQKMILECQREYDRNKRIPVEMYQQFVVLTSQAESVWEDARHQSDFAMFQPYLQKIVDMTISFTELWGYEDHPYNTLLDMYEPGIKVAHLDDIFGTLRAKSTSILQAIQTRGRPVDVKCLQQTFEKEKQKQFSHLILKEMQYDFDAGRLDESVHPFATGLNPGDVRITTRYVLDDLQSALFGTIHEGGHALYEQNIANELIGTNLCTGTSMGIHESQSRFWENMIGRSKPFWSRYYRDLQQSFSQQFASTDVHEFYRAINHVEPSLVRVEADELTYNLHIIIRYEIEKALMDRSLRVADVKEVWNAKYLDVLGVKAQNDREGVLQDVHWSGGAFGYFPSYALGNMYAAQFTNTMQRNLPQFNEWVASGNLKPIKHYLTEHIYRYGKMRTPNELIVDVTGEALNPQYLADYLEKKYKDIYQL